MPPAKRVAAASPARRTASPAPRGVPKTDRVLRSATPVAADKKKPKSPPSRKGKKAAGAAKPPTGDFYASLRIYAGCVGTLVVVMAILVRMRPASPPSCNGVAPTHLLPAPLGTLSTDSVKALWQCTKAYQEANWWFVFAFFETLYIGIKMLAIPAAFTLCILAGALFPFPLCQVVTGFGEAIGSSLCFLLSQIFLGPIVEHFFAEKLEIMREKALAERQYMLSFNFFLRLTPFMPNWMINLSCPLVGVPLQPFFIGSLFGTQLSLLFLAVCGATLREAGESGFDLDKVKAQGAQLAGLMFVLQCIPIAFIWLQKRRAAA